MKNQLSTITDGYRKRQRRYVFTALTLLFLTFALACIMMIYGNTIYSPKTVLKVLSGEDVEGAVFTIRTLRLPRMLTAILCGLAFGMAGNTFQQLLGNPLASPDIIGVTSGASEAAVFGILVLKLNGGTVSLMAVFSGLLVSVLIYFLSQGGGISNARLILTGIGMQAFLSAVISWMLLKSLRVRCGQRTPLAQRKLKRRKAGKCPPLSACRLRSRRCNPSPEPTALHASAGRSPCRDSGG